MNNSFDGNGLSREQLQAKAEAAEMTGQLDGDSSNREKTPPKPPKANDSCDWRGDARSPEPDDLVHSYEKRSKKAPAPADTCDWRGDARSPELDDLAYSHEKNEKKGKQATASAETSDRRGQPAEQVDDLQMPIPRLAKVDELPEMLRRSEDNERLAQKPEAKKVVESPARDKGKSERGKRPKNLKTHAETIGEQSSSSTRGKEDENESPSKERAYSPWIDSLGQMPPSMLGKVESGIKNTIEGAINLLTPRAEEQQQSPEPNGEKGATALAPESAAPLPAELFVPSTRPPPTEELPKDGRLSKKQEREKKRAERKARQEAKRNARRQKRDEKKEKRRAMKEKKRKEKELKKAVKGGGELPAFLIQGLRPGMPPYNPKCEICKMIGGSKESNQKKNSECPACAKAAERESTQQFLKTANIDLGNLPSHTEWEEILGLLKDVLRVRDILLKHRAFETMSSDVAKKSDQEAPDEGLVEHMGQHVRSLILGGRETDAPEHKCEPNGEPGHAGRHGYDGNDSPASTNGGQEPLDTIQSLGPSTRSDVSEDPWWIRAMHQNQPCSLHSSHSPYRSLSPHVSTPLPRARTAAAYEPEMSHYPRNYFQDGGYTYNLYVSLPYPSRYSGSQRYSAPFFPRPVPSFWQEPPFSPEVVPASASFAETLPSDSEPPSRVSRDYHLRSRSGSV